MIIGKGTKKLRTDKLGDFVTQQQHPNYKMGEPKRQVWMGENLKNNVESAIIQGATEQALESGLIGIGAPMTDHIERITEERKEYNEKVTVLNPRYASLEPQNGFILRCFVYTGEEYKDSESSLIVGQYGLPKVQVAHERGKDIIKEEVIDPYAYRGNAVVVAVPYGETIYKPGDLVQINQPRSFAPKPGINFIVPEHSYLHPNTKNPDVPKDITDEDFGYVLVSRSQIILRYQKAA